MESRANTRRRKHAVVFLCAFLLLALVVGLAWISSRGVVSESGSPRIASETGGETVAPPSPADPADSTLSMTERVFRARGGDHRPKRGLCDERAWAGMAPMLEEIGAGEVSVNAEAWEGRTVGTQVGLASWISTCVFEGGAVLIRANSGEALASYDRTSGFKPAR